MATATTEEKLAQGLAYKDEGNQHFKEGEWQKDFLLKAVVSYHHAALYLAGLSSEGTGLSAILSGKQPDNHDVPESRKQLSIVRNNMAACFLKLEKYSRAVQCANQCLDIDPNNLKASYRRLQALRLSNDLRYKAYLDDLIKKHPNEEMLKKELEEWTVTNQRKVAEADKKMSGFLNRKKPAGPSIPSNGSTGASQQAESSTASVAAASSSAASTSAEKLPPIASS
ncbi:hypothetical protein OC861_004019 [Tilletia horrida]|nr:hypothetical protein OC861_004019 [Tilletia horrida]